jgi:hypothetical protein
MQRINILCAALLALACAPAWSQSTGGTLVSLGTSVSGAQLSTARGGTDTTVNDTRLHGTTGGNVAVDVQTGTNTITDGAFANLNGLPVVIQNTGANVLIQNAVVVNVQLR